MMKCHHSKQQQKEANSTLELTTEYAENTPVLSANREK